MISVPLGKGSQSVRHRTRVAVVGVVATAMVGTGFVVGGQSAAALPGSCEYGTVVCISQSSRTVRLVKNGHTVIKMSARFGAKRTPTRYGTYRIYWKNIDHVSSLYGSAMPFAMFYSGGQAVHYSSDFARNGYSGRSHGCVNTRDWSKTQALFRSVGVGTKVVVY
ncbi:MAG: L,D-transpeptidase [Sporichthyaceae bacterium]